MVAPAFPKMKPDLVLSSDFESQMVLSLFMLASAVSPLIHSPLSEVYGRRPVLSNHVPDIPRVQPGLPFREDKIPASAVQVRLQITDLPFYRSGAS